MRKTMFLVLALLLAAGAVLSPAPPAEAAICQWYCDCEDLRCSCPFGGGGCRMPPDLVCFPCP